MKKFIALALVIVSVFALASTALAAYSTMYINCPVGETVRLRSSPNTSGTVLINIPRGTAVQAESYNSTWHRVSYNGYNGYMMSSFLSYWDPDEVDNAHPQTQEQAFGNSLLKKGQTSYYVKNVQIALDNRGYNVGTIDGIFGTNTYNAVVQFQQYAGSADDGIVGPDTKEALWLAAGYYLRDHGVMSL